ncbi:MAG: hypothetical protein ACODAA_08095, partial [Gemmatimonadota bacterium]
MNTTSRTTPALSFVLFAVAIATVGLLLLLGRNDDDGGATSAADYDVVIRGGTVYDGTGAPGVLADLAIAGDTIAAVGDLPPEASGEIEIDATGLALAPGFINVLSWAGETLIADGPARSDIRQGVTLEVMG